MTVLGSSECNLLEMYFSFLQFVCEILKRGLANFFWNYVIQISIRQMFFQDIYSNL
jgi:hypothetical protein